MSGYMLVISRFEFIKTFWHSWKRNCHCYDTMEILMQKVLKMRCI